MTPGQAVKLLIDVLPLEKSLPKPHIRCNEPGAWRPAPCTILVDTSTKPHYTRVDSSLGVV
jgi:hypothetical protein